METGEKVSCASVIKEADTNQKQLEESKSRSVSSNLESQKERRLSSREGDDDSEDDNDVVMVELDEDFVVERVNGGGSEVVNSQEINAAEVVGEQSAPTHRCVLCGRTFNHYDNLQVHLTGHLGVKVNINRCNPCQKNFKNKNELDLHTRSHKFTKMLGKYRINKNRKTSIALKKKIISTVGSSDKKIVRKYVKKRETAVLTRVVEKVARKQPQNSSSLTCAICEKGFGVRSIFVRHVKKFHPDLAATMLQSLPQVNVKKCKFPALTMPKSVPASPLLTNGHASSKPKRTPVSPKKFQDSFEKYVNPTVAVPNRFPSPAYERSYSSPAAPVSKVKAKAQKTPKTPKTPKTADYYSTLE